MKKRVMSILLCLIMALGMLPTVAFAEGETTNISVVKQWSDTNHEPSRPESITVNLLADGIQVDSLTMSADANGKWSGTFMGKPVKDENSNKITYTVTEDPVANYTASYTEPTSGSVSLTSWRIGQTGEAFYVPIFENRQQIWVGHGITSSNYYIWTAESFTEAQQSLVIDAVNRKATLTGTLTTANTFFVSGCPANVEGVFSVKKENPKLGNGDSGDTPCWVFTVEKAVQNYLGDLSSFTAGVDHWTITNTYVPTPDAPELESRTKDSITLKEIPANANGAKVQYRINDGEWQDRPVFTGLSSSTEYKFTARYAELGNYAASLASDATVIATCAYSITNKLTNITSDNTAKYRLVSDQNTNYTATLTASGSYLLPATITVTVGGTALTAEDEYTYSCTNGELTIPTTSITGDIVIQAAGVAFSYSIAATPAILDFDIAAYGYTAPAEQSITIKNTGNQQVKLTQPTASDYTIGNLSKTDLEPNDTATFTVHPKAGLSVASYDETLTVSGNHGTTADVALKFTVTKAEQTAPDAPELESRTKTSITLKAIDANSNGAKAQYRMGDGNWQDSPVFTGLDSGTEYSFTARYAELDNYAASLASEAATFRTSSGGGGYSYSYYTIKATAGANGSISPNGSVSVRERQDKTFTITPDEGYAVAKVLIDGKNVGAVKSYTFENVRSNHTIEVTFTVANPQTGVFVDVPEDSYYEEAVNWAVENGITEGTDATHFTPDGICTRAQAVTFLWRAAGSPAPKSATMPFTDVKSGMYYYDAVLWAVENGITKGTSATEFSPNQNCSRAQIVTFLWRSENAPAAGSSNPFTDVKEHAYYTDAVLWAVKEGVTKGTTDTTFSPDANCTRAQIVTFIWRALAE